jgi:MFS family permease
MEEPMTQAKIGVESQTGSTKTVTLALAAVFLTYFLSSFMTFGLSISSPMIAAELNGMDLFSWAISLPALAMAFVTLLFGKLSDMYGRRTMLLTSLFLFVVGAILAAVSQDFVFNIVARVINGLGLGALAALCFSVIGDLYAPVERSKWTGLLQISAGVAGTSGLILGGMITDNLNWRFFFWATVPVALVCGILVIIGVPRRTESTEHKIDYIGACLLAVASSSMILGFSFADRRPWISFHVLGLLLISLAFWYLFIRIERRVKEPILDPQVFTNRTFLTAAVAAFLSFFGFVAILNYFPLFLQGIQETSAKMSGAILAPFSMLMNFMGVPAGFLIAKTKRYKWMLILSYAVLMIAMSFLVFFNQATPLWLGVVVMILGGVGVGSIPTINFLVVQFALPKRFMGISVAAIFFVVLIGLAVAPAILGPAMNATYEKKLEKLLPPDLALHIDAATLESIADPSVLISETALEELQSAFNRIEDKNPMLFDQTVQAVRSALQSGLKVLYLIGSVALLIALLFILTIPEVSMDAEVQDKNPGS